MELLNIFGGGLWIVPFFLLLAGVGFSVYGVKQSKSGSWTGGNTGPRIPSDKNVPFIKTSGGIFGTIFLVFTVVAILVMVAAK